MRARPGRAHSAFLLLCWSGNTLGPCLSQSHGALESGYSRLQCSDRILSMGHHEPIMVLLTQARCLVMQNGSRELENPKGSVSLLLSKARECGPPHSSGLHNLNC